MTIEIQRGKAVPVDRGNASIYGGQGLIQGLGVIWRHWVASFKKNERISDIRGTFTVEYPEERLTLSEAYRNMPILLYDDANGQELCTSCFQCERICPPQVIHMTQAKDPATGKAVPAVAEFVIEYDACMSCGFCAEVCPFDAIKMDHEFELSTADHPSLTVEKRELNRPISYYEAIAPSLWAEVKDSAYKKLQGNIKRRSGTIGIAPQMVDKVDPLPALTPPAAPKVVAAVPATSATPVEVKRTEDRRPETGAEQTGAAAPPSAQDKAAKLAAIRAANAAKQAGGITPPVESAPAVAPEAPVAPPSAQDKAARLAAIRAANAAKANDATTPVVPAPPVAAENVALPAAEPAASDAPVTPASTPIADEKAARLAAIRAANAVKKREP